MSKKSIADLERYEKFLNELKKELECSSKRNIYDAGEVDRYDMAKNLDRIESIADILVLLHYEIKTATLSNLITYNNEDLSLYQAELILKKMNESRKYYEQLRDGLWESKTDSQIMKLKQQTISERMLSDKIESLLQSSYQLENKIVREKGKTFIEVDMQSFVPSSLSDVTDSQVV